MPKTKDQMVEQVDEVSAMATHAARLLRAGRLEPPPGISPVIEEAERIAGVLDGAAHDADALTAKIRRCDIP